MYKIEEIVIFDSYVLATESGTRLDSKKGPFTGKIETVINEGYSYDIRTTAGRLMQNVQASDIRGFANESA